MANSGDVASIFGTIHEDFAFKLTVTDVDEALLRVASFRAVEESSSSSANESPCAGFMASSPT